MKHGILTLMGLTIRTLTVGHMQANCYLISDEKTHETLIIDPGDDAEYITDLIQHYALLPTQILATHGHVDHIMAAAPLQLMYDIPFFVHPADRFLLDRAVASAEYFLGPGPWLAPTNDQPLRTGTQMFGNISLDIIETPGHTPGSVCFRLPGNHLITGDLLFAGGAVGRTDFSYGDMTQLAHSLQKLPPERSITIYPGHGPTAPLGETLPQAQAVVNQILSSRE